MLISSLTAQLHSGLNLYNSGLVVTLIWILSKNNIVRRKKSSILKFRKTNFKIDDFFTLKTML